MTSIDDLKSIAMELGVSDTALEAALREQLEPASPATGHPSAATAVAASGLALGAAAGLALSTVPLFNLGLVNIGLTGLGLLASGAILILEGSAVTVRSFGARNFVLWGGYAAGSLAAIAVFGGSPNMELSWIYPLGDAFQGLVATTVLGSAAALAVRRVLPAAGGDKKGGTPTGFFAGAVASTKRIVAMVRHKWTPTELREVREFSVNTR